MKHSTHIICTSILVILLTSSLGIGFVRNSTAQEPTPKLYIDPPSIIDTSLVPPKNFTVTAKVADVANLYGVEFRLYWDTTILDLIRVQLTLPWSNYFIAANQTNEAGGWYWLSVTAMPPAPSFAGNTTLVTFTFKVTGTGNTLLDLTDTILGDPYANLIPHDVGDGFFSNIEIIPARVYIQPSSIINPELTPPKNFTININIEKASDLYSFDLKLSYNTTILDVAEIEEGPFLKSFGTTIINKMEDDPATGTVWIAISLVSPAPPASGNGTLAMITFQVTGLGDSSLHLYDTTLSDKFGGSLLHETSDGYFNNVLLARLYIDPPVIIDPSLTPAQTFTVDIKIANITNLYGYGFKLSYNTSFLNGIGIQIFPHPSNETHFTSDIGIDDVNGIAFVNVSYYSPAMPISTIPPIKLATITFQVQTYGFCFLHLYETTLVDDHGSPITHVTDDGFVSVAPPDVAILQVTAEPTLVYPGTTVNVTVVAANLGIFRNESFNVTAYYGSTVIATVPIIDLPPLTNITLLFSWNTAAVPPNDYVISALASVVPLEQNTTNNFLADGVVHVTAPDVAVLDVIPDFSSVYQGWKINITVIVQNQGLLPITFSVTAYYNETAIGTKTVTNLASNANATLKFLWDTTGVPYCHNQTISAQASIILGEVDIADNEYTSAVKVKIRIVGDVNADGTVNVLDLILVDMAFGSKPGDPNYNMYADVNRDGNINVLDMIIVSTHLGESC